MSFFYSVIHELAKLNFFFFFLIILIYLNLNFWEHIVILIQLRKNLKKKEVLITTEHSLNRIQNVRI